MDTFQRKNNNSKGSISVFLIIILVPMVLLAGVIVDCARYEYAKMMVASAGDLAMNATLATYDKELNNRYGLFAVSQTDKELASDVKAYFEETLLVNKGISASDGLKDVKGDTEGLSGNWGSYIDLQVEWQDGDGYSGLQGTELGQAPILKTQIVEFMKYRTPVYGGMSIISALSSFKKLSSQAKVTKAQTKVNDKIEDMNVNAKTAYDKIDELDKYDLYNREYIENVKWVGNLYEAEYKKVHEIVRELHDGYDSPKYEVKENKTIDGTLAASSASNLDTAISQLEGKATEVFNLLNQTEQFDITNTAIYKKEYYKYEQYIELYNSKIDAVRQLYALRLQYDNELEKTKNLIAAQEAAAKAKKESYTPPAIPTADFTTYDKAMDFAYQYSNRAKECYEELQKAQNTVNEICEKTQNFYQTHHNIYAGLVPLLESAATGLEKVIESLDAVNTANDSFENAIAVYNGGDDADSFAAQMQNEADYNKESFDKSSVQALKTSLEKMKEAAQNVLSALEKVQYCNTVIGDIKNFDDARAAYNKKFSGMETEFSAAYILVTFPTSGVPESLNHEDSFYRYLKVVYGNAEEKSDEQEEKEQEKKNILSKIKEAQNAFADSGGVDVSSKSIAKADSSDTTASIDTEQLNGDDRESKDGFYESASSGFDSMFSLSAIEHALENARDNIFVADYVTKMFTYNSIDNVYKDNKDEKKSLTGIEFSEANNVLYGAEVEYVIFGKSSASDNVKSAKNMILIIRIVANTGYAVTSSQVDIVTRPIALGIQVASGGIIPYKVPELLMETAIAVAESYIDLGMMMDGKSVAVIKSDDTWVLSPKGLMNISKDLIKDASTKIIKKTENYVVSSVTDLVNNAGSYVEIKTEDLVTEMKNTIDGKVESALAGLGNTITCAVNGEINKITTNVTTGAETSANAIIDQVIAKGKSYITSLYGDKNECVQNILNKALEVIEVKLRTKYSSMIDEAVNAVNSASEDAISKINKVSEDIQEEINTIVQEKTGGIAETITSNVNKMVDDYTKLINSTISEKGEAFADDVIDKTNSFIDKTFDSIPTEVDVGTTSVSSSTGLASMLKFSYLDYLRVFLFMKLAGDGGDGGPVIERIGDLIEINMAAQDGYSGYKISNSYTYIQFRATAVYKPTFISQEKLVRKIQEGASVIERYTVNYSSILGY